MSLNPPHTNSDPLYEPHDASEYINRPIRTMANDRAKGAGPAYLKIGGLVRYRKSALDEYLRKCEVKTVNMERG